MANKKLKNKKRFETQVYNRKIIRNMLKRLLKSNKIRKAWHELQKGNEVKKDIEKGK